MSWLSGKARHLDPPKITPVIVPQIQIDGAQWRDASFEQFQWNGANQNFDTTIFWVNGTGKPLQITALRLLIEGIPITEGNSVEDGYPVKVGKDDRMHLKLPFTFA